MCWADSSASGPLITMPSWAPRPVPISKAVGVASPSAHGQAMINTATDEVNANETPEQLDARVKQLEAQVTERTRAVQILKSGGAGQTTGFANRMEALARRHVDGLWLDQMILSGTNGGMTLRGATIDPDVVPQYLRSLAAEPALSGTRFDDFVIERPSKLSKADAESELAEGASKPANKNEGPIRFKAGSKGLDPTSEAAS